VIDRDVSRYFTHGISVSPGDTILDLGANIGLFGLRATQRCRGDIALYCVEPIPQIRVALKNNLGPDATIIPWAIGDSPGVVELDYFPRIPATSGISTAIPDDDLWVDAVKAMAPKALKFLSPLVPRIMFGIVARYLRGNRERVRCDLRTISQVIDQFRLDRIALLKLDIEGSELAALRGIDEAHWPYVQQIVAEIHDPRRDLSHITQMIEQHGFTVAIERDCSYEDCCNLYAIR
jgi:FkbM family methyltransferase